MAEGKFFLITLINLQISIILFLYLFCLRFFFKCVFPFAPFLESCSRFAILAGIGGVEIPLKKSSLPVMLYLHIVLLLRKLVEVRKGPCSPRIFCLVFVSFLMSLCQFASRNWMGKKNLSQPFFSFVLTDR